jgi:hypothetical protein
MSVDRELVEEIIENRNLGRMLSAGNEIEKNSNDG